MFKIFISILILTVLTLAHGSLLKTEQMKSYDLKGNVVTDGSVKDDGFYQAGKARSYSRIRAGVVIDNATGLEWQDDIDSVQKKWRDGVTYPAAEYCSTLPLDGYIDWRLPNKNELLSIIDYRKIGPAIYSEFVNKFSYTYWSSTTNVYYTNVAWLVKFSDGSLSWRNKTVDNYVQGGLIFPFSILQL